jgi:putative acyl-CoA dehydrogenase
MSGAESKMHTPSPSRGILNQSPPLEEVDLFRLDQPLVDAVAANGGAAMKTELSEFGRHWGSAAMVERGRLANQYSPRLLSFDAGGARRDEIEFHPAYHELMAESAHAGIHSSTWTANGKAAAAPSQVVPLRRCVAQLCIGVAP